MVKLRVKQILRSIPLTYLSPFVQPWLAGCVYLPAFNPSVSPSVVVVVVVVAFPNCKCCATLLEAVF